MQILNIFSESFMWNYEKILCVCKPTDLLTTWQQQSEIKPSTGTTVSKHLGW